MRPSNLADRIAVIAAGRIVAEGTPQTLGGRDRLPATISFTLPSGVITPPALPADLHARAERDGDGLLLTSQRRLANWALARGLDLPDLDVRRPSLEDVYLHLTRDN
jgi:ABC-2 type transport system ATP-binding protein